MPKYGIHYIVLQKAIDELLDTPAGSLANQRGDLLQKHSFFATLGAIGPDLFFYAPDYDIIRAIIPFFEAYRKFEDVYEKVTEPIEELEEELEEAVDDTLDQLEQLPLVGSYVHDIRVLINQLRDAQEQLEEAEDAVYQVALVQLLGMSSDTNPIGEFARGQYQSIFQPGLQKSEEEPDWYWFDMLHYRRAGEFARNLLSLAGDDEELTAYALAYLSHIATDVVGHPYVNLICGAPYRIAVQRHVTAENFMDQWKWTNYFDGENIRATLHDKLGFENHDELPDKLAEQIQRALMATYGNVSHPLRLKSTDQWPAVTSDLSEGFLSAKDIQSAYKLMRATLELLGENPDLRPEEPYPGADADLAQVMNDLSQLDPPPPLPPPPIPDCDWENIFGEAGSECFDAFVGEMQNWANMVGEAIRWCFETADKLLNLAEDAMNNPQPGTPVRFLQLLVYAWQWQVYQAYRYLNHFLAINGLIYPEPDEASLNVPWAIGLITPSQCWSDDNFEDFPRLRPGGQSHLQCPSCSANNPRLTKLMGDLDVEPCCELPRTVPAFYPRTADTTPDVFIHETLFDPTAVTQYAGAATPEDTRSLYTDNLSMGNAVDFTAWLVTNAQNPAAASLQDAVFCNWNLDGDRGYAYKDWEAVIPDCDEMGLELSLKHFGEEYARQFPRVWPDATARFDPPGGMERYIVDKTLADCFLTGLNLSENAIPEAFAELNSNVTPDVWEFIVPERLRLTGDDFLSNVRYVNGITTPGYVAIQEFHQLMLTLRDIAESQGINGSPVGRLLHNRTQGFVGDIVESIPDKFYAYRLYAHLKLGVGDVPRLYSPPTIAVVALLQHAMQVGRPLFLAGYSQGTLITGAGVMAFRTLGPDQEAFLKDQVKLLHCAVVHDPVVQGYLGDIVRDYRAYTNSAGGDPFTLTLAQPIDDPDLPTEDQIALLRNPRLDANYWLQVMSLLGNSSNQLLQNVKALLDNILTGNVVEIAGPHVLDNYLEMLKNDVETNQDAWDFLFG